MSLRKTDRIRKRGTAREGNLCLMGIDIDGGTFKNPDLAILDSRLRILAQNMEMNCGHSVGICCGWHYEGYNDHGGNPCEITKSGLYWYVKSLEECMKETERFNPSDKYDKEQWKEIKAIKKAVRKIGVRK